MSKRLGRLRILLPAGALACAPGTLVRAPGAPAPAPPVTAPGRSDSAPAPLPSIPRVTGPLALRVVYPPEGARIAARDSNFIFGSVGSGDAALRINGTTVPVRPNGSFLAFLPVTPAARARAIYDLVATRGEDTARLTLHVASPPPRAALSASGGRIVDSASVEPRAGLVLTRWEPVLVSIRALQNAAVELQLADGSRVALVRSADTGARDGDPDLWAAEVAAVRLNSQAWISVIDGSDSVRLPLPRIGLADSAGARYAVAGSIAAAPDTDRVIIARPVAGGTYKWFLLPGTVVEMTGRIGGAARVRLDRDLEVFVDPAELSPLAPGASSPRRVAGNARVVSAEDWSDVRIPLTGIPAYAVDAEPDALILTLFGARANTDIINYSSTDSVIQRVTWRQVTSDRAEYRVALGRPPFGYLVLWERNVLVLRVRRPPRPDAAHPLDGLTIAVDAGHPPGGATGPTGLYEPVATLAIAERVKAYLEQRGARVVMTRTAPGAVALVDRPIMARRANADAFVSIHLNALPDGVNPFTANGTGTYFFNVFSEPLARDVQRRMVARMGLRDLGVNYDNLAVLRPTWMPSVLCEGAFLMIPEQEAALRTPEFQDAYARGVADGLEAYFRSLARP